MAAKERKKKAAKKEKQRAKESAKVSRERVHMLRSKQPGLSTAESEWIAAHGCEEHKVERPMDNYDHTNNDADDDSADGHEQHTTTVEVCLDSCASSNTVGEGDLPQGARLRHSPTVIDALDTEVRATHRTNLLAKAGGRSDATLTIPMSNAIVTKGVSLLSTSQGMKAGVSVLFSAEHNAAFIYNGPILDPSTIGSVSLKVPEKDGVFPVKMELTSGKERAKHARLQATLPAYQELYVGKKALKNDESARQKMNHKNIKDVFGNSKVTEFNAKRSLHYLLGHASVSKGSPVDLLARKYLGKLWEDADPFDNSHCDICLSNKAHRFPHPRKSVLEKAALDGPHPPALGEIYVDSFSWPFAAHDG